MKHIVYFASEENGYELEKTEFATLEEAMKCVGQYGVVEGVDFGEETIPNEIEANGFGYATTDDNGYHLIVGIATEGHGDSLMEIINDVREDFVEMFGDEYLDELEDED